MTYSINEAKFILLHYCSIEKGIKQCPHSDDTNKVIGISKRETAVRS
jgi:hypothetical protein